MNLQTGVWFCMLKLQQVLCHILLRLDSFQFPSSCNICCRRRTVSHLCITFTTITSSQSQMPVITTLPNDGHFQSSSFLEIEGFAIPSIVFSCPVQNERPMFHLLFTIQEKSALSISFKTHQKLRRNHFSLNFALDYEAPTNPSHVHL